jgi:putative transposase
LLGVNRSNFYYQPQPVSDRELDLRRRIDELYTEFPYYGSPKITAALHRQNIAVNHKLVERLMRNMGLSAIVPKRHLSNPLETAPKYPYLLRNLSIIRPNQVWGTDITYVRASGMWFYLVAIMDWFSRYVLAWQLSEAMSAEFCAVALEKALQIATPEIHNSDQGAQFTSQEYLSLLLKQPGIRISMDGRGRCFDNIFTERLWRTVKYEEIYLHDYGSYDEAAEGLGRYFRTYNRKRLHQALDYRPPAEVYFQK